MTDERKTMIDAHPGGISLTERLLALGGMDSREKGRKLLDLGAGKGESTEFLRNKGWDARGIDLVCPENSEVVIEMDMRRLEYDASSFDVCLAECSLSGCGDGAAALKEGYRVLRPGGVFLVSDVYFQKEEAPADLLQRNAGYWNLCRQDFRSAAGRMKLLFGENFSWKACGMERQTKPVRSCSGSTEKGNAVIFLLF